MIDAINKLDGAILTLQKDRQELENFISTRLTDRQKELLNKKELRLVDFNNLTSIRGITHDRTVQEKWLELSIIHRDIEGLKKAVNFLKVGKLC